MVNDFIPRPDGQFTGWAQNLVNVVSANPKKYGLTTEDVAELESSVTAWESKFGNSIEQRDAAKAA